MNNKTTIAFSTSLVQFLRLRLYTEWSQRGRSLIYTFLIFIVSCFVPTHSAYALTFSGTMTTSDGKYVFNLNDIIVVETSEGERTKIVAGVGEMEIPGGLVVISGRIMNSGKDFVVIGWDANNKEKSVKVGIGENTKFCSGVFEGDKIDKNNLALENRPAHVFLRKDNYLDDSHKEAPALKLTAGPFYLIYYQKTLAAQLYPLKGASNPDGCASDENNLKHVD